MQAVRRWSVRRARFLDGLYDRFEWAIRLLRPIADLVGYQRLEAPVARIEHGIKGFMFDCQMCGHCVLGETGMACPMNCPKNLRNGPCGGVRSDGNCEVEPDMRCVWVEAWEGSQRMVDRERIMILQPPVDHRLRGTSSWLRVLKERLWRRRHVPDTGA